MLSRLGAAPWLILQLKPKFSSDWAKINAQKTIQRLNILNLQNNTKRAIFYNHHNIEH